MNKLIAAVLIIVLNFLLSQFLPWWNFIPLVIIVVWIMRLSASASWMVPALSLMILWLAQIFILDQKTGFRSSERIADIFDAPGLISYLIPILGVGLLATLAGMIAYLLRTSFQQQIATETEMHIDDYHDTQSDLRDKGII